jgi:hypothetical protein
MVIDEAGKKQIFDTSTSGSYLSANDRRVVVGVGKVNVKKIEIRWPSGVLQTINDPEMNRYLVVNESQK